MRFDVIYDVVVVGGGIVGCATAFRLLQKKPDLRLLLIEKEEDLALHQSKNNSGVIHSGLYYKPGSLKAMNCRQGYHELLAFCEEEQIHHEICGKIVVATSQDELSCLDDLYHRGQANGLKGLRYLCPEEVRDVEPYCQSIKGLWVPETGIIDYYQVAHRYAKRILQAGGDIKLNQRVLDIHVKDHVVEVVGEDAAYVAKSVVVCAGLYSDRLAYKVNPNLSLRIVPFRGEYYQLKKSSQHLVKHLIYPVPDPAFPFLGVHFTRMTSGGIECGPNAVFAFGREAYHWKDFSCRDTLDAFMWPGFRKVVRQYWRAGLYEMYRSWSKSAFVKALQKLIPDITSDQLELGGAGIRAQACDRAGRLLDDFNIQQHQRVMYVCNAPSPAATASLSIGNFLSHRILDILG